MDDRKVTPVFSGVLAYFPRAIKKIAKVSFKGNQKHNPGTPLHWAKNKSTDHPDSATRHVLDPYDIDPDTNELSLFSAGWRIMAWSEVVATALDWNLCTIDELRSGLVTVASLSQRIHDIEENERNNQTQWATLTSSEAAELVLPVELDRAAWAKAFEIAYPTCRPCEDEDTWSNWGEANCMCDCSECYENGTDANCVEFEIDTDLEGADENGDEYFYDCLGGYQEVDVQPVVLYDIETKYKGSMAVDMISNYTECTCDLCSYDPEQFE